MTMKELDGEALGNPCPTSFCQGRKHGVGLACKRFCE